MCLTFGVSITPKGPALKNPESPLKSLCNKFVLSHFIQPSLNHKNLFIFIQKKVVYDYYSPQKSPYCKKNIVPKENPVSTNPSTYDKDDEIIDSYKKISSFLKEYDEKFADDLISQEPSDKEHKAFEKAVEETFADPPKNKKAVLGIDIYKYSKYNFFQQKFIPFIFSFFINNAMELFFKSETFFSSRYNKETFKSNLVNTGDGGYLFFQNPIDAIVFLSKFNAYLHLFNSYHRFPKLRKYLGPLTIRYTITYDQIYKIESKYYGPAIIKNARIISKDKLNRFLIDDKTYEWFLLNTNGIENLLNLRIDEMNHLKNQNHKNKDSLQSVLFSSDKNASHIQHIFCQKLEKISVKDDDFEVYNLMIQCFVNIFHTQKAIPFITSIGNMNCNGI